MIGYDDFRREQAAARAQGRYLGLGIGTFIEQTAHGTSEFVKRRNPIVFGYDTVSVSLDPSGKVTVASGLHSHGQGHETTLAQVVAERLGVPLADVRVRFGDTESSPYGLGTFASRSAVYGGGAAWKAADKVRHNLLAMAAHMMEANPDDLEIAEGVIQVKGSPQSRMTVAEVARLAYHRPERLPPGLMPADLTTTQNYDAAPGTGTWANAAHAAIVDVDIATGFVRILRYVVVEDCGVMINPLIVDGQVHGGAVQGIGGAMMEHLVYDEDHRSPRRRGCRPHHQRRRLQRVPPVRTTRSPPGQLYACNPLPCKTGPSRPARSAVQRRAPQPVGHHGGRGACRVPTATTSWAWSRPLDMQFTTDGQFDDLVRGSRRPLQCRLHRRLRRGRGTQRLGSRSAARALVHRRHDRAAPCCCRLLR